MSGFTKLFSSITESSIWCEDDKVLRVWVAMLARVNADGIVEASVPGFANLCRMPVEEMARCLDKLRAPDPYSRTPDNEGRRIEDVPGGWRILNYTAYRERGQAKDGSRAPYMRKYRQDKGKGPVVTRNNGKLRVTKRNTQNVTRNTEAEAEAEAEAEHTSDAKVGVQGESPWAVAFGLEMPETLRTAECMASIRAWLQHKAETRKSYKPSGLAVALGKWSREFTPPQFCAAVEHSMANGWSGLFHPKEPNGNATAGGRRLPSADRNDLISGADDDRGINAAIARDKANLANPDYLPFQ